MLKIVGGASIQKIADDAKDVAVRKRVPDKHPLA
jgi:hypothetical protein